MRARHPKIFAIAFTVTTSLTITGVAQSAKLPLLETNSTITLSFAADDHFPENFRSVLIRSSGTITRLHAKDQIIRIPTTRAERKEAFVWSADAAGLKMDPSRYFLVGHYSSESKPHTLLFFLSDAAGGGATPLLIIGFSDQGKPFKVFERPFELTSFEPDPVSGSARFIGFPTLSQVMYGNGGNGSNSPYATTYDPRAVYIVTPDRPAHYSLAASEAYNQQHYVWAGPTVSEQMGVVYNYPGRSKPFSVPAKQLHALFAKLPTETHKP